MLLYKVDLTGETSWGLFLFFFIDVIDKVNYKHFTMITDDPNTRRANAREIASLLNDSNKIIIDDIVSSLDRNTLIELATSIVNQNFTDLRNKNDLNFSQLFLLTCG